jgi:uncharacterized membrane protein YsdA (DUF1294 family)
MLTAVLAAELAGFALFSWDKAMARAGRRRIPEARLLLFTLIGGIGAWMGQRLLRHKTRKEPFRTRFGLILTLHLLLLAGGALYIIL